MTKKRLLLLFIIVACIQFAIPLTQIIKREIILKTGEQFKFKVEPIDPHDPFRGAYVAIRINNMINVGEDKEYYDNQKVYVIIKNDNRDFAYFDSVSDERPKHEPYIIVKVKSYYRGRLYIDIPFDRFYMEERKAKKAEYIYRRITRDNKKPAYILVRILNGNAVLENLFIDNIPIVEYIKKRDSLKEQQN